jgi:hypothetical protein
MNSIHESNSSLLRGHLSSFNRISAVCLRYCQKALHRLSVIKSNIEREFGRTMSGYEQLLSSALNEAEALAWQTPFPHLLFPVLAEEKAVEAQHWAARQRAIRQQTFSQTPAPQLVD